MLLILLLKNKNTAEVAKDLWSLDDVNVILENFYKALQIKTDWSSWVVDKKDYNKIWLKK